MGLIPGLTQWVKGSGIAVSCGIGHRQHGAQAAVAVALIWPLAWEFAYATGVALKSKKKKLYLKIVDSIFAINLSFNHILPFYQGGQFLELPLNYLALNSLFVIQH